MRVGIVLIEGITHVLTRIIYLSFAPFQHMRYLLIAEYLAARG